MGPEVEATTQLVDQLLAASGSRIVPVGDLDVVAHALAAGGAVVIDGGRSLDQAIQACVEGVGGEFLFDADELRRVAARRAEAHELVERSLRRAEERLSSITSMVMHPESIRSAAGAVQDARAALGEATATLQRVEAAEAAPPADSASASEPEAVVGDVAGDPTGVGAAPSDATESRTVVVSLVALVVAVALAALVFSLGGGPIGAVLPALALGWVVVAWRRSPTAVDNDDSDTLAHAAALSDLAFPGAGNAMTVLADELGPSAAVLAAARARDEAGAKVVLAEDRWRSLVGDDVAVEDLEEYLRRRDPQLGAVSDSVARSATPVRAAQRRARRIEASWRAMWWSLDREPPGLADADGAIAGLVAQGLGTVTTTVVAEQLLGQPGQDLLVVVVDRDHEIAAGDFGSRTAALPDGTRVIALVPERDDTDAGQEKLDPQPQVR